MRPSGVSNPVCGGGSTRADWTGLVNGPFLRREALPVDPTNSRQSGDFMAARQALCSAGGGVTLMALSAALASFGVTALVFGLLWLYSLRRRDCSVVDLYWAFGFAVI